MPQGLGWTGVQWSTPPSGNSSGSVYAASPSGNASGQVPSASAGAPNWMGGLMSSTVQQGIALGAIVLFLAVWYAHAHSLMD